ncbi:tetratricopeptide repeat protein [Microcystis flos-aquae]|uniref:tetratricopeptide repeat protein n=1 Tax=Microcystis flos-aquae TaxID=109615 RepID=UPI0030FF21FE
MTENLNNLAKLYHSQGRYAEAEPLYQQALDIAEQALGENHPNTIIFRENLQTLRQQQHPSS